MQPCFGGHPIPDRKRTADAADPSAVALHLAPAAVGLVAVGGGIGAAARDAVEQVWPAPTHGFPAATFVINLAGSLILGLLIETLVRSGDDVGWRRRARLLGGAGFCGGFTTYSTLAVETIQLARHGAWSTGVVYVVASVVGGLLAAAAGIMVGAARARGSVAWLPVDPDVDRIGRQG